MNVTMEGFIVIKKNWKQKTWIQTAINVQCAKLISVLVPSSLKT